ncbi:hypothetical protein HZA97_02185 [Candidatus Woesearchaeota archaeon]|nr:hypothetical protein [Candidatus Woesearchaeota archaeon]
MVKSVLTWDIVKDFLAKELSKTKHILTYGTIGSCNIERDIDTIITKKSNSSHSDFYKEVHGLFDSVKIFVKQKYRMNLIVFNRFEPEAMKLSNYKKGDLVFHVMIYTSLNQLENDWKQYLFDGENVKSILDKNYADILGKLDYLFGESFKDKYYYDPIYIRLYEYDRLHSNYQPKFLVEVMNKYFDFILRKRLNLEPKVAKNEKDLREIFYLICAVLDEKSKKFIK